MANLNRQPKHRQGTTLVELALVLPILIMTLALLIEVGRVMLLQHTADTAAYEGARAGMIPGATPEDVIEVAQALLDANGVVDYTIDVQPNELLESTTTVSVNVTLPVKPNTWLSLSQVLDFDLSSNVMLFCERPTVVQSIGLPKLKDYKIPKFEKNDDAID